jgi:hypothetical protein
MVNVRRRNGRSRAAVAVIGSAAAQHTIVLWKHEAKLGNASAEAGGLFDKEDFEPGVGEVESSAHPTNAAANNHGGSHGCAASLPIAEDGHRAPHHQTLARLLLHSLRLFLLYSTFQSLVNMGKFFTNAASQIRQSAPQRLAFVLPGTPVIPPDAVL